MAFEMSPGRSVVILGGGFGGLFTALHLTALPLPPGVRVTLVTSRPYFLFTPLLYDYLAGQAERWEIAPLLEEVLLTRAVELRFGRVEGIDLGQRTVLLDGETVSCDLLVIALGSTPARKGVPGAEAHARAFKTLDDVDRLREHLRQTLQAAAEQVSGEERARSLTTVIIGAGPTGVELSCHLAEWLRCEAVKQGVGRDACRLHLVETGPRILPGVGAELRREALEALEERGVNLRLSNRVTSVSGEGVELHQDGTATVLPASTVVWTGGTSPPEVVRAAAGPHDERGRLLVSDTLQVEGHPEVLALGDSARFPAEGEPAPATAYLAYRQAATAAWNVRALLLGLPLGRFRFSRRGVLLTLGRSTGAAFVEGCTFSGYSGHLARKFTYLWRLPGYPHRMAVAASWLSRLFDPEA